MPSHCKLSVHIVTYNQAGFLRQALDSVLMQRVGCTYEVLIGDDCSTDGTTEILKEYQQRYPEIIKPIFREKNLGPGPNAVDTLTQCTGDYVAFLEGDDYWTDPDKIRLQIDYLDQHPGCSIVHHTVEHIAWPTGECLGGYPPPRFRIGRPDPLTLAMVNFIQTCTVMFRRSSLPNLDERYRALKIGDWPLFVLLSQNGWIGYLDRTMAHYRIHPNNTWNNRPADYKIRAMEGMAWFLLERVNESSKVYWQDTILALAFKDLALSMRSLALTKVPAKLNFFLRSSLQFKRPFWLFRSLWPYYKANYAAAPTHRTKLRQALAAS